MVTDILLALIHKIVRDEEFESPTYPTSRGRSNQLS